MDMTTDDRVQRALEARRDDMADDDYAAMLAAVAATQDWP